MLDLLFLGGKSDMAAWSSIIWHESAHLIENGQVGCKMPRNTLYLRCNPEKGLRLNYINSTLQNRPRKVSLIHLKNVKNEDIKIKQTLRGVCFNIRGETAKKLRTVEEKFQQTDRKSKSVKQEYWTSKPLIFSTKNKYAKLGW